MSLDKIRESGRYSDISWLMEIIDVDFCLERLNIRITKSTGDNWEGYCPDHYLFVGSDPSDPKWYLNIRNGKTMCMTEPRGSNFLYTVARLLRRDGRPLRDSDCEEAVRFLTGRDCSDSEIDLLRNKSTLRRLGQRKKKNDPKPRTWKTEIEEGMSGGYISDKTESYFMTPPGKPPTNITLDTLRHYGVHTRTSGYYANRAIVPILQEGEVSGFVAIDILGKKEWLASHPTSTDKDYRKVLYPTSESGFTRNSVLFGLDDCARNADYIIMTEGVREVMKLYQEGFGDSVAILGAFLSDEQLMLITKHAPKGLVLMFDGDRAGRRIADTVASKTSELFRTVTVELPDGVDPKQLNGSQIEDFIQTAKEKRK